MSMVRWNRNQLSNRSRRAAIYGAAWVSSCFAIAAFTVGASSCGGDGLAPPDTAKLEVASISIDLGSFPLERGFH